MSVRMYLRNTVLAATCAFALLTTTTFAAAVHDFFGRDKRLNAKDLHLLQQTLLDVLEAKLPGAFASWEDRETKEAGRASVVRYYEHNGMVCADVQHIFTTGNRYRYVLPFCQKDGEWKMAF